MLHAIQARHRDAAAPGRDEAPWRGDLEDLRTLLQDSRPRGPSRAQIAALIEAEAPGALSRTSRERIAERLARVLAQ
ncbi:hypothetical protein OPKNFCMD_3373 [Methylobacterium crusticola]|uniref:Uncharacterized protein n=1 Tax=Methylobacterium crusticola TaxID=1697972 RepID=A0ABQ4R0J7_9HYPH|nr:hypothetical protein [Methylobacterium crusticola]GJD50630.1 hypothetical protein OPKNFCMD_3373 [Methylobacterium crusticola]